MENLIKLLSDLKLALTIIGFLLLLVAVISPIETKSFHLPLLVWQRFVIALLGCAALFLAVLPDLRRPVPVVVLNHPVGGVQMFAGVSTELPVGWLPCEGQPMSSKSYPELYRRIGQYWGIGDNSNDANGNPRDFTLPDLRGRFPRGVDDGSHNDPDVAARKPSGRGRPDQVGSLQGHAFQTHTHQVIDPGHRHPFKPTGGAPFDQAGTNNPGSQGVGGTHPFPQVEGEVNVLRNTTGISLSTATATGGLAQVTAEETRPINAALYFIIRIE